MYQVATIGGLTGPLAGQEWPDMPAGWVPPGTPGLPDGRGGVKAEPLPGPPRPDTEPTTDAGIVIVVAVASVGLGVLGYWLVNRYAR